MTSYIDYSGFVLSRQWQEASGEIHCSEEIHVDLMLDNGIGLPFEFPETHDTSIIHQIAEL